MPLLYMFFIYIEIKISVLKVLVYGIWMSQMSKTFFWEHVFVPELSDLLHFRASHYHLSPVWAHIIGTIKIPMALPLLCKWKRSEDAFVNRSYGKSNMSLKSPLAKCRLGHILLLNKSKQVNPCTLFSIWALGVYWHLN